MESKQISNTDSGICAGSLSGVSGKLTPWPRSHAWRVLALLLLCLLVEYGRANPPSPGGGGTNTTLETWSFDNTTPWANDRGYAPLSFTNLSASLLGDGTALVVDSTNAAWLQYNVVENDGTTNLALPQGTVMMWFAPNWIDVNSGGSGPGQPGRFIEVGFYTTNASYGWWSLWLDRTGTNIYFSAQTNGSGTTYLSAPVSWSITNRWHMLTLTYSSTNTAFYFDGAFVTNGPAVTIWPGPNVVTNGFFMGSDNTGTAQVHGMIDDVETYNYVLDTNTIAQTFQFQCFYYYANPMNRANFSSAGSYPTNTPDFNVVSGSGGLTTLATNSCAPGSSVWITNVSAKLTNNGTMNLTFTIMGGWNGWNGPFDVFANAILGPTNATAFQWTWMGQGYSCNTYVLTNLPVYNSAYVILGTPQDSNGDGLTDAYCLLVLHTNPNVLSSAGDGIPDAWKVLWGLSIFGVASQDPDHDGLTNLQEYLWGSNPTRNEGLTPWVACPTGFSGIP